jgi:hypothetical protein
MRGKIRLIAIVICLATIAGGAPAAGQEPIAPSIQGAQVGVSAAIQGTAVNWTNAALASAPVRLRDARRGRALQNAVTDRFGAFEFRGLDAGSYVVELLGTGSEVLAATPIINLNSGQSVAALVKLPFRNPPAGGVLGKSLPAALAITSAAVAAGVLATTVTGAPATDRALPGQR